jgi:RNA polymerase sporulation-specific sigma factor
MALLEPRDRALIELRYFGGQTQTRTAERLGMTQVQVSRREKKILERLRQELLE